MENQSAATVPDPSTFFEYAKWFYDKTDIPAVVMGVGLLVYCLILFKWHMDKGPFDFRKALIDPPEPGSVSLSRLGQLTALVVTTSVVIYQTVKGNIPEWMFAAYGVTWAGTYIAAKYAKKRNPEPATDPAPPPGDDPLGKP